MKKNETGEGWERPDLTAIAPRRKNDGSIAAALDESGLEVRADFMPPAGNGEEVTADYVRIVLDRLNISYGIRWDAIEDACLECKVNRRPVKNVSIARGDAPQNEVAEYFALNPELRRTGAVPGPSGRIDYRSFSPFIIVKQDQILARRQKRRPGRDGRNVHGETLPHEVLNPPGVSGGENTVSGDDAIVSKIHGQLIEKNGVLNVQEKLVIKGGVGYATGNINFPGDVFIHGPVSDGFKIYSGGSVTIKQTFDVTDVIAKTDLSVAGGIIGRGRALVKVGGALRTRFIENCRVACRKGVTVENDIVNSSVFTMESLEMGDRGTIVGGEIYAVHGIRAGGVGRKGSGYARLHCGIDFAARQELEKRNNALQILGAKLKKLRDFMASPANLNAPAERGAKMEELLQRLEEEQRKTQARVAELLGRINIDSGAVVEVSGEILPGTQIEICGQTLKVAGSLRKVRVRLDTAKGKLTSESL